MTICWRALAESWTSGSFSASSSSMTAIRRGEISCIFTPGPLPLSRFFFELTERRAGYALYGAANAAVRLAAMQYC